jgi:hypothetical protein
VVAKLKPLPPLVLQPVQVRLALVQPMVSKPSVRLLFRAMATPARMPNSP